MADIKYRGQDVEVIVTVVPAKHQIRVQVAHTAAELGAAAFRLFLLDLEGQPDPVGLRDDRDVGAIQLAGECDRAAALVNRPHQGGDLGGGPWTSVHRLASPRPPAVCANSAALAKWSRYRSMWMFAMFKSEAALAAAADR